MSQLRTAIQNKGAQLDGGVGQTLASEMLDHVSGGQDIFGRFLRFGRVIIIIRPV